MPKPKPRKRKPVRSAASPQRCTGHQLDHRDGSMSCSRGDRCSGLALPHQGWRDCDLHGPCAYCDGPLVVWAHHEGERPGKAAPHRFDSIGDALKAHALPPAILGTVNLLLDVYKPLWEDEANPACGGPLLIHQDGAFECHAGCPGATAVLHLPEALQFCYHADLYEGVSPYRACPACAHLATGEALAALEMTCTGAEIDHEDGATTCTLGPDCIGADALHATGMSCSLLKHCPRCR